MFELLYQIFQLELDGEEFDSDDDAILAFNLAMREVLSDRNWKFLLKSATLTAGTLSLDGITDLDKVIDVYAEGDVEPLRKASFEQRFDTEYDYWVDVANNAIVLISDTYATKNLVVSYKYRPADITEDNTPLSIDLLNPVIAYTTGLTYYRKDQDSSTYQMLTEKREKAMDALIMFNESL